jgi:hypothetical protein
MSDEKKPGADFDLDDETLAALADDRDDAVAAIRRRLEEGWSLDGAILLHGTRELRNSRPAAITNPSGGGFRRKSPGTVDHPYPPP